MLGPANDRKFGNGKVVNERLCQRLVRCHGPEHREPTHLIRDTSAHRCYQNYAAWSAELHHLSAHSLGCVQYTVHIHVMHLRVGQNQHPPALT